MCVGWQIQQVKKLALTLKNTPKTELENKQYKNINIFYHISHMQNAKNQIKQILLQYIHKIKAIYHKKIQYIQQVLFNMNQSMTEEPQCLQPTAHELKHNYFCFTCAARNINANSVCFCVKCYKKKYTDHKDHKDFYSIDSKTFRERVISFRRYLLQNSSDFDGCKNRYLKEIMENEDLNLTDLHLKKWLIAAKFWKFQDQASVKQAHENLMKLVTKNTGIAQSTQKSETQVVSLIDWSSVTDEKQGSIFEKMYEEASRQKQNLLKQKQKMDILLEIFTSLQMQTKEQLLDRVTLSIEQYPDDWGLILGKLYLMQLHEENKDQWLPLLKRVGQLNPKLKDSHVSIFLESHQFWVKLGKEDAKKQSKDIKFIDAVTGNVFKLTRPQEAFVNSEKPPTILQSAKGIGLMAQSKYTQALKILQNIPQKSSHQTFQMNKYYCQLKQNPNSTLSLNQLISELENKSKQYIINAIKYLKKNNLPHEIVKCCEWLHEQNNQNTFVKIQCVKALLKLDQIDQAAIVRSSIPKEKVTDAVSERLRRKQIYAEARIAKTNKNFENATNYCQSLVRSRQSASSCYSLASSYYNQQKWQEAQKYINKALALKQIPKYQKLKLYIHIMKKQLDEAKVIMSELPKNYIDPKITEMLNQFGTK